jgi:hypothetical protein
MTNRIGFVIAGALLATSTAWAGPQLESTRSTCGAVNCAGMTIRGIHQPSEPFVVQIYAREGECLRLDVREQTEDLAMFVLGPTVWIQGISDDRAEGDVRPLIVQDPMPATGWYTVVISHFDVVTIAGRFVLDYGRYPTGNINCQEGAITGAQMLSPSTPVPAKSAQPAAPMSDSGARNE